MPSAQVIDLSPMPRTETTNLEKTLSAFSQRQRENQVQQRESDALSDIYKEYQQDGQNLEKTIFDIQSRPGISPTTRVNTIKQLVEFREHNTKLQKEAKEASDKANQVRAIEKQRGLEPGSLSEFDSNPALANQVTKQPKEAQANKPIVREQQANINAARNDPAWENANDYQRYQIMTGKYNVSKENAEAESKASAASRPAYESESSKRDAKRTQDFIDETNSKGRTADIKMRGLNEGYELWKQNATGAKLGNYLADYFGVDALKDPKSVAFNAALKAQYSGISDIVKGKVSNFEFQTFQGMIADASDSPQAAEALLVSAMMEAKISQAERDLVSKKRQEYYDKGEDPPKNFDIQIEKELRPMADLILQETNQKLKNILSPTKKNNPNTEILNKVWE